MAQRGRTLALAFVSIVVALLVLAVAAEFEHFSYCSLV